MSNPVFADIPTMASYLISGYWGWAGYQGTAPRQWQSHTLTVNITGLNATEQGYATSALNAWHDVANVNFVYTSGAANITFNHNLQFDPGTQQFTSVAYTAQTVSNGHLTSATIDISSNWASGAHMDNYMFQSYIHEIGHALGLGHQGPYNDSATYGVDNIYANDTWQWSIMSYFNQSNYGGGTYTYLTTPQMVDVYAIQELYGANTSTRLGNTIYGFHSNAGPIYDFTKYYYTPSFLIYDTGGTNTLDCSEYAGNQTINLNPGTWSSVDGGVNNVGIYLSTTVQKAIGGSGNDVIFGNAAHDRIDGGAGSNVLYAGTGPDRFVFDTSLMTTFDTIVNFAPGFDKLVLSRADFAGLNPLGHVLKASMFHVGPGFTNGHQRFDYNPADGWLTYDSHGNHAGSTAIHVMTLATNLGMHHGDLVLIA